MEKDTRHAVHCPDCYRYVSLPEGGGAGSEAQCPFCSAKFRVEEMTVLVARPLAVEAAQE